MDYQLFTLLRNYYALTPTNKLQFPSKCTATQINDFLVAEILVNEHHRRYPPSIQYQRRFWKWAIENLEYLARKQNSEADGDEFEIDSRIYDNYMSLMLPGGPTTGSLNPSVREQICGRGVPHGEPPPSQSYVTHFWNACEPLPSLSASQSSVELSSYHTTSLLESRTMIESGTTGLRTWFASFILAQYLILHSELVTSQNVLELGSGVGFLGIIITSLQQLHRAEPKGSCWLTDVNDEVLARCRDNINLPCNISSSHKDVNYLKLDWFESLETDNISLPTLINDKIDPDLILGADVTFVPALIPALVGTLKISLQSLSTSKPPKAAIIAVTLRNEKTINHFLRQLEAASLHVQELPIDFDTTSFSETVETHISCDAVKLFRITLTP